MIISPRILRVAAVTLSLAFLGCNASAQFHSKTGRIEHPVAAQAIQCDENEARVVMGAGGEVIGTISAQGLHARASDDDVAEKASSVAAAKGGTHMVLTDKGAEQFVVNHPAQKTKQCVRDRNEVDCVTTYTPPSQSTYSRPTARFLVLRVRPEQWGLLPPSLRPLPAH